MLKSIPSPPYTPNEIESSVYGYTNSSSSFNSDSIDFDCIWINFIIFIYKKFLIKKLIIIIYFYYFKKNEKNYKKENCKIKENFRKCSSYEKKT